MGGLRLAVAAVCAALVFVPVAIAAPGDPDVAALQVALHNRGFYSSTIDGWFGSRSADAVRAFQRSVGLPETGFAGPLTREALGDYARFELGSRLLSDGAEGWDVAALQFSLAWHGFPSGPLDGIFAARTTAAVLRFQHWAELPETGVAGPLTLAALRAPPPSVSPQFAWPVEGPLGDRFGPREDRFHAGIDIPAAAGAPVTAAANGRVTSAGWLDGGFGNVVTIAHGDGVVTWYAHLSRVTVAAGDGVVAGTRVGLVGATGHASGPHLHFEVRVRGAAVDPLPTLP